MPLFFTILTSTIILYLGFLVYFHDNKSVTNRIFFIQTIITSVWSVFSYISIVAPAYQSLFWIRLVLLMAVPHVFVFFLFVMNFPNQALVISKKSFSFLLGWMYILMFLTQTPYVFETVLIKDGSAVPQPGQLIPYFAISLVIVVAITFFLIFRKYRRSPETEKKQWLAISAGLVVTYSLLIGFIFLATVLFSDTSYVPYSSLFIIPMFIGASYAILRHKFLNVKVFTTELFSFSLVFISIWQVLLAKTLLATIFQVLVTGFLLFFSILLVRSVFGEVKQREETERLSKRLEEANKKLVDLDKAKSEFLSVASHQLRTPLTAIKGYMSMLLEGDFGPIDPKQKDTMNIIYDSSQRLVELIADLLDLSRIESGTMEFNFDAVDLCKIVDSVIEEVRPKTEAHNLYLYFDNINRSCPMIRADAEKLRQVVINLIDNAVKYTTKGGVTVRLQKVGSKLQFSVSDTGIGIDPADQSKLFQKFFRTDAANEITREGTGLGIYVVQKLVDAMGGKIWFESPGLGKGTSFYVTFNIPDGPIVSERIKIEALF